jgi:hypothetical protein
LTFAFHTLLEGREDAHARVSRADLVAAVFANRGFVVSVMGCIGVVILIVAIVKGVDFFKHEKERQNAGSSSKPPKTF